MSLPSPVDVSVAGLTFCKHYPKIAYRILEYLPDDPPRIKLVREPDNPYDANAVKLVIGKIDLGHVPANMAKRLAPELDKGVKWTARVSDITIHPDHRDHPGIWVRLTRH